MTILITDWGDFERALPIATHYHLGLEVAEFTIPQNLEAVDSFLQPILEKIHAVSPTSLHGPFAELVPASRDPLIRQVARRRFDQAIRVAHSLQAEHLVLHSGFIPKTYPPQQWLQNSIDFWANFVADQGDTPHIHVENVYEDDFTSLQALVDGVNQSVGREALSICLDIGHVNANSSRSLEAWIDGLRDRIRYVHLHNNGGILDDHWRLDRGKIDMRQTLDLLRRHSPYAAWTVETVLDDLEPSLLWLQHEGYL